MVNKKYYSVAVVTEGNLTYHQNYSDKTLAKQVFKEKKNSKDSQIFLEEKRVDYPHEVKRLDYENTEKDIYNSEKKEQELFENRLISRRNK